MSRADRARPGAAGLVALLGLLLGGLALVHAPRDPGAIRIAGVSALWWYVGLVAPLGAGVVACLTLRRARRSSAGGDPVGAVALWTAPAVLAPAAGLTFEGAADAPLVMLVALLAPLVTLLGPLPTTRTGPASALVVAAVVVMVLGANLLVLGDAAAVLGVERWRAVAVVAAAWVVGAGAVPRRWRAGALVLGLAGLATPLVIVAMAIGAAPWDAWRDVARQERLVFEDGSAWVTEGRAITVGTALEFSEPHRVTALAPATLRLVERDRGRVVAHDWRLGAGDALVVRSGDRLEVPAGARVRFEPGKRVPGAPPSGAAWADPAERNEPGRLPLAITVVLSLGAGAVALGTPTPRSGGGRPAAAVARAVAPVAVLVAASWGVYAARVAVDLALGGPRVAPLVGLGAVASGWAGVLAPWLTVASLALLGVVAACALHDRLAWALPRSPEDAMRPRAVTLTTLWTAAVAAAGLLALRSADPWSLLTFGLGLGAAAVVAPAIAGAGPAATGRGAVAGAVVFAAAAILGPRVAPWASLAWLHPAMVAAPVAWCVARASLGSSEIPRSL